MALQSSIGHYRIVKELGRGGMGVVYQAHEQSLNRHVAIKVLGEHLTHDESFVKRFVREAQSAAALSHPNVIQIYFIGRQENLHYFVMEFVEGRTVQQILKEEGPFEPSRAARIVYQAASGLAAAHERGLIHRDIKPANLLIARGDHVKIADFGLALMPEDGATRLTGTGMLMGTPGYLSPEQCNGEPADARSDIYSLGMTFYEMLAGAMPFKGESPLAVLRQILHEQPPSLTSVRPEIASELAEVVEKMIEKDPALRYQSCHEVLRALEGIPTATAAVAAAVAPVAFAPTEVLGDSAAAPMVAPPGRASSAAAAFASPAEPRPSVAAQLVPPAPVALVAQPGAAPSAQRRVAPVVVALLVLALAGAAIVAGAALFGLPLLKARFFSDARAEAGAEPGVSEPADVSARGAAASMTGSGSPGRSSSERVPEPGEAGRSAPAPEPRIADAERLPGDALAASAGAGVAAAGGPGRVDAPSHAAGPGSGSAGSRSAAVAPPAASSLAPDPARPATEATRPSSGPATGVAEAPGPAAAPGARAEVRPTRRRALPAQPRVTVVASGEPNLAAAAEQALESQLARYGFELVDEHGMLELRDVGGSDAVAPSELLPMLDARDVQVLVMLDAVPVAQRELNALGRFDVATTARLRVSAFATADGRTLGKGWNDQAEYTPLNASRQAERVIGGMSGDLAAAITDLWQILRREEGQRP